MTRYPAARSWTTMGAVTTTVRTVASATLASLALAGCASAPAPLPSAPLSLVAASPTTCEINYNGPPDAPDALHLDCADTHWSVAGPWQDSQTRYLDEGAQSLDGMKLTKALVVGGEGRAWVSTETLSCVATRDLLDTEQDTRVRCHVPEPEPEPSAPPPASPAPPSA